MRTLSVGARTGIRISNAAALQCRSSIRTTTTTAQARSIFSSIFDTINTRTTPSTEITKISAANSSNYNSAKIKNSPDHHLQAKYSSISNYSSDDLSSSSLSKKDLIKLIAEEHDLTNAKAERIVNGIFDTIVESVTEGKIVSISGFGKFQKFLAKERMRRNPQTGEPIFVPSKNRVSFRSFKSFKDSLNE